MLSMRGQAKKLSYDFLWLIINPLSIIWKYKIINNFLLFDNWFI
jgi:hypothetical protein